MPELTHFYTAKNRSRETIKVLCKPERIHWEFKKDYPWGKVKRKQWSNGTTSPNIVTCPECLQILINKNIKLVKDLMRKLPCPACTKGEFPHRNCVMR